MTTRTQYDLLLKGGHLLDPDQWINGRRDIAFKDGRVAEVAENLDSASAREVVDVSGKLVTPGLIDLHGHYDRAGMIIAVDPDSTGLIHGVTTGIDAGSVGFANYRGLQMVMDRSKTRVYSFLHIGAVGLSLLQPLGGELQDQRLIDVDRTVAHIEANRDRILGIKIRMDAGAMPLWEARSNLRKAAEAAQKAGVLLMAHISRTPIPLPEVLDALRPGDIATHIYNGNPENVLDEKGDLRGEVSQAAERGVIMDVGDAHTNNHVARQAMAQGFMPRTLSTDYVEPPGGGGRPRPHMPDLISKYVTFGMSLEDAVAAGTSRPAAVLGLEKEIGSLGVGMEGDAAVLERQAEPHTFDDGRGNPVEVAGNTRLVAALTVRRGEVVWRKG